MASMSATRRAFLRGVVAVLAGLAAVAAGTAGGGTPTELSCAALEGEAAETERLIGSTADHAKFEVLEGPFESGPEVTEACLSCHTEAAGQVHRSIHWTWHFDQPGSDRDLGKRNLINNRGISIAGSYERCSSCHVGYGWSDADFDFTDESRVDCLVCHDTTGDYVKDPTGAGHPPYETVTFQGEEIEPPELAHVAQNVGPTSRQTCGSCHLEGGAERGDLQPSLMEPPRSLDVHMAPDGADMSCASCHEFTGHLQRVSRYRTTEPAGIGESSGGPQDKPSCVACHGAEPHEPGVHDRLNAHSEYIACQTCHIPELARGGGETRTLWDWSEAGRTDDAGEPVIERDEAGRVVYDGRRGAFEWAEDLIPQYRWFNGNMRYTLPEDPIDPEGGVPLNRPQGAPGAEGSRIWPFKVMHGKQPYDRVHEHLLVPQTFGGEDEPDAYMRSLDWERAITSGMEEARALGQIEDATYSGDHGFVETRMYWPSNHMVAPAEASVACADCHSDGGRMSGVPGVYVPGDDGHPVIERIGWAAVLLALLGVLGHGGARYYLSRQQRREGGESSTEEGTS